MHTPWAEIEPVIRDRAYRRINAMPELLLEQDSWFTLDADLIYARLLGFEDEVVRDGLRLTKVEHDILVPIPQRRWIFDPTPAGACIEPAPMRTARYALQSCFVTLRVSAELYEIPVEKLRADHTAEVAYLRYRRRA